MLTKVLTIAGFDPSAGAGILADIKAFEYCKVYGQAACTAITVQNENNFNKVYWLSWEQIKEQLEILFKVGDFEFAKIGLVESPQTLERIFKWLCKRNPNMFILWDPILKASSGFEFHNQSYTTWLKLLTYANIITPNLPESEFLRISKGSPQTAVLVKGGHSPATQPNASNKSEDLLFLPNSPAPIKFSSKRIKNAEKHGSGCTLSALIIANMAKNNDLCKSIRMAKVAMQKFFQFGSKKLGSFYHL